MTDPVPPPFPRKAVCQSCHREINAEDVFCSHCGQRQVAGARWYYQPLWILVLALTVLGPIALILVWRSPVIKTPTKWILGVVIVAATILAIVSMMDLFQVVIKQWNQTMRDLEEI